MAWTRDGDEDLIGAKRVAATVRIDDEFSRGGVAGKRRRARLPGLEPMPGGSAGAEVVPFAVEFREERHVLRLP